MNGLAWSDRDAATTDLCRIACESSAVSVSLFRTGNGSRLKLMAERTDKQVLLDATVLEALCTLTPARALELVRQSTESAGAGETVAADTGPDNSSDGTFR